MRSKLLANYRPKGGYQDKVLYENNSSQLLDKDALRSKILEDSAFQPQLGGSKIEYTPVTDSIEISDFEEGKTVDTITAGLRQARQERKENWKQDSAFGVYGVLAKNAYKNYQVHADAKRKQAEKILKDKRISQFLKPVSKEEKKRIFREGIGELLIKGLKSL